MKPVDLHTHSNKSDGTYTPAQLVDYAVSKGLSAVALTDHDTIDGLDEAVSHAEALAAASLPSKSCPGSSFLQNMTKRMYTS